MPDPIVLVTFGILIYMFSKYIVIKIEQELQDEFYDDDDTPKEMYCLAECIDEMIYVWDDKSTFIVQAKTSDEIIEHFIKKYPNTKVYFKYDKEKIKWSHEKAN